MRVKRDSTKGAVAVDWEDGGRRRLRMTCFSRTSGVRGVLGR